MNPTGRTRRRSTLPRSAPAGQGAPARPADPERLEALGRLSAGVVHDFSNLLFVIIGQVEMAQALLPQGHPATAHLLPALQAAERASSLARGLLTFARRSSTDTRIIDLNAVVMRLDGMLRPVFSEDIAIDIVPGPGLRSVCADPIQMEHLLLNLALNARDAMPEGGRLRIETRNVESSDGDPEDSPADKPVLLLVSDDGAGMDATIKRHIFEPFFTTKTGGTGSGLGLSSVLDIVEHDGGSIAVDSCPGYGTTFRIYLPCSPNPANSPRRSPLVATLPGGTETILIVEQSEPVREIARALLGDLGYDVLSVRRADEALALARAHRGPIHLLLTDLAMPGAANPAIVEEFGALRPATRCLSLSRYSDDGGVRDFPALPKPADQRRLAHAVREALDSSRPEPVDRPTPPVLDATWNREDVEVTAHEKGSGC